MSSADRFASLEQVRAEIDRLDRDLLRILGERAACVSAAATFKTSAAGVRAPERVQQMLTDRRAWAEAEQLDSAFVEELFRLVTSYFIVCAPAPHP
jgi:isochorismate pyruvate lyase